MSGIAIGFFCAQENIVPATVTKKDGKYTYFFIAGACRDWARDHDLISGDEQDRSAQGGRGEAPDQSGTLQ
jgi:hypothetical protein